MDEEPRPEPAAPTIYELNQEVRVDIRRLPALLMTAMRLVWRAARIDFALAFGLQLVAGVITLAQLVAAGRALQALLAQAHVGGSFRAVLPWVLASGVLTLISTAAGSVQQDRQQILGELVRRLVETDTLEIAEAVDLDAFEIPAFHNRLQRVQMAGMQAINLANGAGRLAGSAASLAGVVAALIVIRPVLVPMLALALVPAWLAGSRRSQTMMRFTWQTTPKDRERNYLSALITSRGTAKEVRALSLTGYLRRRVDRLYDERIQRLREIARGQMLLALASAFAVATVSLAVLLLLTWFAVTGQITVAEAGVAVGALAVAGGNLARFGFAAEELAESSVYMDDYLTFVRLRPPARDDAAAQAPGPLRQLSAQGLRFRYPGSKTEVLQGIDLELNAGEAVALVGENGSGKTTLAKLLAGLYAPTDGRISWNGVETSVLDRQQLYSQTAVIFQDFIQFHLPVWENVALGRHDRASDRAGVQAALAEVGLEDTVARLPDGEETMLGPEFEGGTDLSIGQWQKLALARVFFRDAPLVILDEPTAALDPQAEHDLFVRIRNILAGRTVLLISHRFSSARSADRILLLENGRLIESGPHHELIAAGGRYAELFELQASGYRDAPDP